jgi:hypothetical protein
VTAAKSLRNTAGADSAGFVHPWVQIPDGAGGVRTISPEASPPASAPGRSSTPAASSTAPFGEAGKAQFVTGAEATLTSAEASTLADGAISPVRVMLGGVRLYDWRSLSADEANWKFLTYRDLVNDVAYRVTHRRGLRRPQHRRARAPVLRDRERADRHPRADPRRRRALRAARRAGNLSTPATRSSPTARSTPRRRSSAGQVNARIELRPSPSAELDRDQHQQGHPRQHPVGSEPMPMNDKSSQSGFLITVAGVPGTFARKSGGNPTGSRHEGPRRRRDKPDVMPGPSTTPT